VNESALPLKDEYVVVSVDEPDTSLPITNWRMFDPEALPVVESLLVS
jgi:hypothetical protein